MLECLDCFRAVQDYGWRLVLISGLMSLGFVLYLEFGAVFWPNFGSEKWIESGLVQGVLRLDDALFN